MHPNIRFTYEVVLVVMRVELFVFVREVHFKVCEAKRPCRRSELLGFGNALLIARPSYSSPLPFPFLVRIFYMVQWNTELAHLDFLSEVAVQVSKNYSEHFLPRQDYRYHLGPVSTGDVRKTLNELLVEFIHSSIDSLCKRLVKGFRSVDVEFFPVFSKRLDEVLLYEFSSVVIGPYSNNQTLLLYNSIYRDVYHIRDVGELLKYNVLAISYVEVNMSSSK